MKAVLQNAFLWLTTFWYSVIIGATVYQMIVIVPVFSANPPTSLLSFNQSGVNPAAFWTSPILLPSWFLFLLSLILNWKTPRRKYIIISLAFSIAATIATVLYFYPRLSNIGFIDGTIHTKDTELVTRSVRQFVTGDIMRFALLIVPGFFFLLCAVSQQNKDRATQ